MKYRLFSEFNMTKWQMLSLIFDSVHFSGDFLFCFAAVVVAQASFYTQITFSVKNTSIYQSRVLSKMD